MKRLTLAFAMGGLCAFSSVAFPTAAAALETYEAKMQASEIASRAAFDAFETFGFKRPKPGQYVWRSVPDSAGPERVVISLSEGELDKQALHETMAHPLEIGEALEPGAT